jgi:hypothetical protein
MEHQSRTAVRPNGPYTSKGWANRTAARPTPPALRLRGLLRGPRGCRCR